jgi:DNA-binding GntR family transcriptional regulator
MLHTAYRDYLGDNIPGMRAPQPPYLRIASELRAQIENGELRPGEQVPSAAQLAERYGVGKVTAQRALALLKEWGLTDTQPGWGTFVKAESPET